MTGVEAALSQAFAGPAPEPPDLVELSGWTQPTPDDTYKRSSPR